MTRITTFEKNVTTGAIKLNTREITTYTTPQVPSRNSGRTYGANKAKGDLYTRTLHKLFEDNEIRAYHAKPYTKQQLLDSLLAEHKTNKYLARQFARYAYTIGIFRKKYNLQTLYTSQPPVYLISFEYDSNGYIVVGGRYSGDYRYFEDCYNKCISLKIADPRFIPPDYIENIRNFQLQGHQDWLEWIVPNEENLKRLQTETKQKDGLYNTVKFRPGWRKEDTPLDFRPLEDD
jgi:hypothetical protein